MEKNNPMNPKVDEFIINAKKWQHEFDALRAIALSCKLTEELKWKTPCYTFNDKNVILLGGFKENCIISFFKGSLMKDPLGLLKLPGENTRVSRLIRFTKLSEIMELEPVLKEYILEAIELEKQGVKVSPEEKPELVLVDELCEMMENDADFKTAFESLTPGRQKGYNLYFSGAKQAQTRMSRIEKYRGRIMKGFGFHDCVCGRSKRMPTCDGSHKVLG